MTYPDGSKDNVDVTVTVEEPTKKPDWDDTSTTPDKPVTIPKKDGSGEVPEGSTLEVEGPGKAELLPNGDIKVTPNDDAKVDDEIKVTVKDKDGNKVDDFTVKIVEKPISSSERKGCTESLLGFGLPLLALIPLGIATQAAIPGLQAFQAQVDQQIRDMNTALQRQLGILDPNMARAAAEFDARLKGAGANLGQVLAGLALLGYGIAAIATIASTCDPKNPEKRDSKLDFSSSLKPGENGSSKKQEGQEGKEGSSNEGSSKPTSETATPEEPTEVTEPTEGDEPSAPAEPTEEN